MLSVQCSVFSALKVLKFMFSVKKFSSSCVQCFKSLSVGGGVCLKPAIMSKSNPKEFGVLGFDN